MLADSGAPIDPLRSLISLQTSTEVVRVGPDVEIVLAVAIVLGGAGFAAGLWVERARDGTDSVGTPTETTRERDGRPHREPTRTDSDSSTGGSNTDSTDRTGNATEVPPSTDDPDRERERKDADRDRTEGHREGVENVDADAPDRSASFADVPDPAEVDIEKLETELESGRTEEKIDAIRTLGEVGAERPELVEPVVADLKRLRLDRSAEVSSAATEAINRIESARK
jgi:hypothetical protein